jgi:acyl-CoA synthetase (AMP-forming)/AMP-acid ligase II
MSILNLNDRDGADAIALIQGAGGELTYRDLYRKIDSLKAVFGASAKALIAIFGDRDLDSIVAYLTGLSVGHACGFFGQVSEASQESIITAFRPEFVVYSAVAARRPPHYLLGYSVAERLAGGGVVLKRRVASKEAIHEELALLLTTSGSMSTPKVVRLSYTNLQSNASAISEALAIEPNNRAITSLPLNYCYGLSVLNSHLIARAAAVICPHSIISNGFWRSIRRNEVTSLAGVPAAYEVLHRRNFDLAEFPSLKILTQAGGKLGPRLVSYYAELMERRAGLLWIMYGQTEATARITCLPPADLKDRPGSVGLAVPGGRVSVEDQHGSPLPDDKVGAVVYYGPNVMLGYAKSRRDLAQGDVVKGRLSTGDLGYMQRGYLYLTGRVKRIAKILGVRIELDEVESAFSRAGTARAVTCSGEKIMVFVQNIGSDHEDLRRDVMRRFGLPPGSLLVRQVDAIPTTSAGKPDYLALARMAEGHKGASANRECTVADNEPGSRRGQL